MRSPVEGLVLTGGCALNVLTNQKIYDLQEPSSYCLFGT